MKQSVVDSQDIFRTAKLFSLIQYKLNFNLVNSSDYLLSTDALRDEIKNDLFRIATLKVENRITTISQTEQNSPFVTEGKITLLFLIKAVAEKFLMKYYGYCININTKLLKKSNFIRNVLEDSRMLVDVPFSLLMEKKKSYILESTFMPVYDELSDSFLEALLENLIVELSNCAMYIILNDFSSVSSIRQKLYKSNFLSLRNIERFKNNLVWQSGIRHYIWRPKNIYDSQYELWIIRKDGIDKRLIYSNQAIELENLHEGSLVTVTYTELQDFLLSRFEEFIYILGNGIRYSLTSVLGQTIGLIWKGIIEGLKR